jgi:hypothetical protein
VNIVDIWILLVARGTEHPDLVTHITHPGDRKSLEERRCSAPTEPSYGVPQAGGEPLAWAP